MNDAGTVIVADVYPAGEAPIPGVTRDALVDGLRARGHRSVVPLPSPARLAEMVFAMAKPGDFVVCLGAGNITAMGRGAAAANWPSCRRAASRGARHDDGRDARALASSNRCRRCAAACRPTRRWRRSTWFRVGGPADVLVRPADAADLAQFLRALPLDIPVHVIGACSNLIIRDGGLPGVVIRLARGFGSSRGGSRMASSPAPRRST